MDLSIIILNFNAKEYVKRCIESVFASDLKRINFEVLAIDNNSTDGSKEELSKLKTILPIKVIFNEDNFGFSKGNNIGVKKVIGKYVLFLNPDTFVPPNTIQEIYKFMEKNPDVGVSCPRLDLPDGSLTSASHRGFPTPWNSLTYLTGMSKLFPKSRLFSGYTMGWLLDSKTPHEVDAISGGFFFVRRKAAEEVGWWDEDYFLYGEDIDFCYRLKEKGWKVMFLPQFSVLHYHGVSSGIKKHSSNITTADKSVRLRAAKASSQAMRIFYEKHYSHEYPFFVRWIVLGAIGTLGALRMMRHSI